ncbi:hypothetical protein [Parasitella parasitica]|uniref:Trichome birefringence-like C-terminal domain-containing protein n=1 Tax=Parasitella parasitica TaxID=35722 RepID=A0A0B7MT65_9FUNG|nr:hypothetical protein [Parasitella parasitica]
MTLLQNPKYTTAHLSTEERDALQTAMIAKARAAASEFHFNGGIPGSVMNTAAKAKRFRSLVDCWTTGTWVEDTNHYTMPHFQDPLYGSCDRRYKKSGGTSIRPAVRYTWKSECDMINVDSQRWCQVLRGRHLLLVGDLVQYQLHELFLDTLRDGPTVCFGELNCKDHTVCEGPETRLRYLRNDILSVIRKMDQNHGHPKANVIEWPFTLPSIMRAYPVVILNRAPVIESDEAFIKGLVETLRTIRKGNPKALILYRSTGIGHPFCDDATEPLAAALDDSQLRKLPHGWSEIERRNAIAREIVEAAGGVYIDLAKLTNLRPDGHIGGQDCLRYCIPGPLDSWAQILYQVFLGLDGHLDDF